MRRRQRKSGDRVSAGLAAASVQLATQEVAALALPGARSPLAASARAAIDLTPAPITDVAIVALRERAKPFLRLSVAGNVLAAGAAASLASRRVGDAGAAALALSGGVAALACLTRPDARRLPSTAACAVGAVAGAAAHLVLRRHGAVPIATVGTVAGAVAAVAARRSPSEVVTAAAPLPAAAEPVPPPDAATSFAIPGLRPLCTPAGEIYKTDVAIPIPQPDLRTWRLRVTGEVDREIELTYDDLLSMPLVEMHSTLVCVHNPLGGDRVSTGRWLGVPVADLLARAGARENADQLLAHSVDGFSSGLPLAAIRDRPSSIVALGVNSEPLPAANGFPARLLTPGSYGQWANVKWLERLEVTRLKTAPDYWARRGWPQTGPVRPGSQIDVPADRAQLAPGEVTIAGVAWSPPHGVRGVEVSIDGGGWSAAELAAELAPTTWRQWRAAWSATPGDHSIRVRCIGQEGRPQAPFPAGYGGYHSVRVTIDGSNGAARGTRVRRRFAATAGEAAHRARYVALVPGAWMRHRESRGA